MALLDIVGVVLVDRAHCEVERVAQVWLEAVVLQLDGLGQLVIDALHVLEVDIQSGLVVSDHKLNLQHIVFENSGERMKSIEKERE